MRIDEKGDSELGAQTQRERVRVNGMEEQKKETGTGPSIWEGEEVGEVEWVKRQTKVVEGEGSKQSAREKGVKARKG